MEGQLKFLCQLAYVLEVNRYVYTSRAPFRKAGAAEQKPDTWMDVSEVLKRVEHQGHLKTPKCFRCNMTVFLIQLHARQMSLLRNVSGTRIDIEEIIVGFALFAFSRVVL
jgi:hypothetical protein